MENNISNRLFTPCDLYFLLWCLYLLQGILYATGGIVSMSLLIIILVMSFYHLIQTIKWRSKPEYFMGLSILVFMFIIYGILLMASDGTRTKGLALQPHTYQYLKDLLSSLLPIFTCYYFSRKGILTQKKLQYWIPVFIVVATFQYINYRNVMLATLITNREDVTNNTGYVFLSLIPCMYVYRKQSMQILGIVICSLFVLFGMKRGAIVIGGVIILIYVYQHLKNISTGRKFLYIVLLALAGFIFYNFLERTLFQNDYFNYRIEKTLEGETSGREDIFRSLWVVYSENFTPLQKLFGYGADGTLKVSDNYAHNDWLEILINQGLFGITLFFLYWILFLRTIRSKKYSLDSRNVLVLIFVMTLMRTFFSMSITTNTIYLSSIFGLSLADGLQKKETENQIKL